MMKITRNQYWESEPGFKLIETLHRLKFKEADKLRNPSSMLMGMLKELYSDTILHELVYDENPFLKLIKIDDK